jgi:hypothetical protein
VRWYTNSSCRNRKTPIGYKLSLVEFDGQGSPRAASNSTTAATDIISNSDLSRCPKGCFRPVGLAWDAQGRLYMSSDSTGEIYIITKTDGSGVANVSRAESGGMPTRGAPRPSDGPSMAGMKRYDGSGVWMRWAVGAAAALLMG